jgi:dephospho-CoA kinase
VRIFGLTGGIASGKSTVEKVFQNEGFLTLDADEVARELREPRGAAHSLILSKFGTTDKDALRKVVFSDPEKRKELEAILHPLIRKESEERIRAALKNRSKKDGPLLVIYDAALLIESSNLSGLDGIILVTAPESTRIKRLMETRGMPESQAQAMVRAQLSDEEKKNRLQGKTHWVVDSSVPMAQMVQSVKDLAKALKGHAS